MQFNRQEELQGGNKTMEYLPLRRPFSSNYEDIQRLTNQNQS